VVIPAAARAVEFARKNSFLIIHLGLGFSEGYPEIPDVGSSFKRVKDNNLFVEGLQAGHEVIGRSVVHIRN